MKTRKNTVKRNIDIDRQIREMRIKSKMEEMNKQHNENTKDENQATR
ncbi:MAG: hypothetical protein IJ301_00430 [Clostridia bacterium]|nr:hypothetical protein [Clostridia bacterium]